MIVDEIRRALRELEDPERARVAQRYFKTGAGQYGEGDRFLGLSAPDLRRFAKEYQHLSLAEALMLLDSPIHEDRALALLILVRAYEKRDEAEKQRIYDAYLANSRLINNWDLVDASAPGIVGAHLFYRSKKPLYELAKSASLWERRIAILATLYFIRQGQFAETLKIARRLLADREDLLHKAVGWMLREVGKRDPETAERFLLQHYQRMPRTMLRYAIERFPEARRQMYLQGKM